MPIKKWAVSKNAIDQNQFAKITKECWADILSGWILGLTKNVSAEMLIINYAFTSSVGTDKCSYICWVKPSPFLYNLSILGALVYCPLDRENFLSHPLLAPTAEVLHFLMCWCFKTPKLSNSFFPPLLPSSFLKLAYVWIILTQHGLQKHRLLRWGKALLVLLKSSCVNVGERKQRVPLTEWFFIK